ncbi:MAG: hypothetical protein J6P78_08685 [Lachnospiraceae bacterium]|nr:hypothetical protein [Lachnospiraceae bacterium]
MYLNKLKIESTKALCNVLIAVGAFFWFLAALFIVFIINYLFVDGMLAIVGGGFMTLLTGGIASALTFPPVLLKRRMYRAEKYNRIFEEDYDGMVPYSAFEKLTGFTGQRVRTDIRVLTDKNILRNVTYGLECAMVIMMPDTEGDFISVDCPHCGAQVQMRVGGGARCVHCGTYLRSESEYVH